ncbi:MAG: BBP7 family outer membrane beta-barrel protein [Candidatus Nealsonbacteria bacterium]|nr:BBP7 family outer membrane beta-barrel protein [Candidatus Nealsonbacteria bacterium]
MQSLRIVILVLATGLVTCNAWGQFGLYGAPEMLPMPQTGAWIYLPPAGAAQRAPVYAGYGAPAGTAPQRLFQASVAGEIPSRPAPPRPPLPLIGPAPSTPVSLPGAGPMAQPSITPQPDAAYGGQPWGDCNQYGGSYGLYGGGVGARRWSPWYGSISALLMTRNKVNNLWLSYESGNNPNNTWPYEWDWAWGAEIRVGRRFCSCCPTGCGGCEEYCDPGVGVGGAGGGGVMMPNGWALEGIYTALTPLSSFSSITYPGGVSTPLNFSQGNVSFNGPFGIEPATFWFDNADEHRIWRESHVQSFEVNLVRSQFYLSTNLPWTVDWSFGIRYFRFDDQLMFGSRRGATPDNSWSDPGLSAYLDDRAVNNLIGFQFGFDAKYRFTPSLRAFVTPKFGIYENFMENRFRLYLNDGTVATQSAFPGWTYPINSSENAVSFLTQIDVGVLWDFSHHWSAHFGYRVLVATAIALADDQVPPYVTDMPEIADIDNNADLILHGGFFGLTYNY